ncbi:MAG: hypothetical protein WB765_14000 [Acidimicrobiales bacterium]
MAGDSARRSGSAGAGDGQGTGLFGGLGLWLSATFLRPAKQRSPEAQEADDRPLTEEEQRRQARMLDPTERKIGIGATVLALIISLGLTVPYLVDRHLTVKVKQAGTPQGTTCSQGFTYSKVGNQAAQCTGNVVYPVSHWLVLMVLLLVFAAAIFITLRVGRRIPLGFAILVSGIAYESTVGLLGLLFIVPGAYLLFRAWKVSRPDTATGLQPQPRSGPKDRSSSRRPQPSGSGGTNKRYTPKAPPAKASSAKARPAKARPAKASSAEASSATPRKKRPAPPAS